MLQYLQQTAQALDVTLRDAGEAMMEMGQSFPLPAHSCPPILPSSPEQVLLVVYPRRVEGQELSNRITSVQSACLDWFLRCSPAAQRLAHAVRRPQWVTSTPLPRILPPATNFTIPVQSLLVEFFVEKKWPHNTRRTLPAYQPPVLTALLQNVKSLSFKMPLPSTPKHEACISSRT
jgi:hypothetical protein